MTRVVSWNVHGFVAAGRGFSPEPALRCLERLDADFIALQEVEDRDWQGLPALAWLAERGGWQAWAGPTLVRGDAHYGNALLARRAATEVRRHELTVTRGHEPRGLLDVRFAQGDVVLRVLVTHFGLRRGDRWQQLHELLPILGPAEAGRIDLLAGDFNEWLPRSRLLASLDEVFGARSSGATFPARRPLFPLDRIYVRPARAVRGFHVATLPGGESDHRPVIASLDLGAT